MNIHPFWRSDLESFIGGPPPPVAIALIDPIGFTNKAKFIKAYCEKHPDAIDIDPHLTRLQQQRRVLLASRIGFLRVVFIDLTQFTDVGARHIAFIEDLKACRFYVSTQDLNHDVFFPPVHVVVFLDFYPRGSISLSPAFVFAVIADEVGSYAVTAIRKGHPISVVGSFNSIFPI